MAATHRKTSQVGAAALPGRSPGIMLPLARPLVHREALVAGQSAHFARTISKAIALQIQSSWLPPALFRDGLSWSEKPRQFVLVVRALALLVLAGAPQHRGVGPHPGYSLRARACGFVGMVGRRDTWQGPKQRAHVPLGCSRHSQGKRKRRYGGWPGCFKAGAGGVNGAWSLHGGLAPPPPSPCSQHERTTKQHGLRFLPPSHQAGK